MAKTIAVEWDDREIRLACGGKHGSQIALEAVRKVPMPTTTDDVYQSVAVAIRKFCEDFHIAKPHVVASVPRGSMEIRAIQLPPADDNELPDLVRFASQRSFAQIGDSWPLDFLKLPPTEQEGLSVLAGAVNPAVISKLQLSCAPLEISGLLVRSIATANLTTASAPSLRQECILVVNVVGQEVDLVVAEAGHVTLTRTVRLPEGQEGQGASALLAEIKRTRFAAESQRGTAKPTSIVLWGDCGEGNDVVSLIENGTGINVKQLFVQQIADCKSLTPSTESLEQFAPLVGMIHHDAFKDGQSLDFLHPRRPVAKRSPYWSIGIAATAAAILVLAGGWWYFSAHRKLDREIADLIDQSSKLDENVKQANALVARWDKVKKFQEANIQWLDQLVYLSDQSLPASRVIFDQATFSADPRTLLGRVATKVAATSPEDITDLEASLRSPSHAVHVKKTVESKDKNVAYRWIGDQFQIDIHPDQVKPPQTKPLDPANATSNQDDALKDTSSEQMAASGQESVGTSEPSESASSESETSELKPNEEGSSETDRIANPSSAEGDTASEGGKP